MRRSKGFRSKTRKKLKSEGKRITITEKLHEYAVSEKVVLKLNPAVQKGMPHPRYQGHVGNILCRRGNSYLVEITDGKKKKTLIARPEHIRAI